MKYFLRLILFIPTIIIGSENYTPLLGASNASSAAIWQGFGYTPTQRLQKLMDRMLVADKLYLETKDENQKEQLRSTLRVLLKQINDANIQIEAEKAGQAQQHVDAKNDPMDIDQNVVALCQQTPITSVSSTPSSAVMRQLSQFISPALLVFLGELNQALQPALPTPEDQGNPAGSVSPIAANAIDMYQGDFPGDIYSALS